MPVQFSQRDAILIMKRAGLTPLEAYVNTKHPWKSIHIKCGRNVSPTLNAIRGGQGPCAYCAGKKVDPKEAEKFFLDNGLKPLEPYIGNKVPWRSVHLKCGRIVSPTYNVIRRGESKGCKHCSEVYVDPQEAFEYFISKNFQPLTPYPGRNKPWKSIHLDCGSTVQPRYGHIKSGRKGCAVCSGLIPISQSRAKAFFREKNLEPLTDFPGPHKPWKSIHTSCGREVSPRWANVQQGLGVCVYCSSRKIDVSKVAILVKKLQLKPLEPFPGSGVPWRCIHLPCGNEVTPRYGGLSKGQGPCIHCAGNYISPQAAEKIFEKSGLKPLVAYPGASKPWKSIHVLCGNKVQPRYSYVVTGGIGCVHCAGHAEITESKALKLFKQNGFEPLVKFPGAKRPWKSRHLVCGNVVSPRYGSLQKGSGCKFCQIGGINLKSPGFFYVITNPELNSHKVGIGGYDSKINRLDQHKKKGWKVYKKLDFDSVESAYELEQKILSWIRDDLMLPVFLSTREMPQGGHTETVSSAEIELITIWNQVNFLITNN